MHPILRILLLFSPLLALSANETPSAYKLKALSIVSIQLPLHSTWHFMSSIKSALKDDKLCKRLIAYSLATIALQPTPSFYLQHFPPRSKPLSGWSINIQATVPLKLSEQELASIDRWAQRLPNKQLIGAKATSEEEVLKLPPKQIDLARGLLLSSSEIILKLYIKSVATRP